MADIHIGKIVRASSGKGRVQLLYHIPINAPVGGIAPTPTSAIATQLQQSEIDALAAGSLVEVSRSMAVLNSQTQTEVADAVRVDWQNVKADCNNNYDFTYKFHGITLNANG